MTVSCQKVGLDYFATAPFRFQASEVIQATPDEVFAVFQDATSWTRWVFAITGVEWTSGFPLGVGSTRAVTMLGGLVGYEQFIAWEPGRRMAFRFDEFSHHGVDAFAEDYRVVDLGNGRCRVDWVLAMSPAGVARHALVPLRPVVGFFIGRTLASLRRHVESRPRPNPDEQTH